MRRLLIVAIAWLITGDQFIFRVPVSSATNPIAAARMPSDSQTLPDTVWSGAGVLGGIPSGSWANCNNTACNDLAPGGSGSVTTATVNAAIAGAQVDGGACSSSTPCVVRIRSGSFTLATGMLVGHTYVAVRGAGPNSTFLSVSATGGTCGYRDVAVRICAGGAFGGGDFTWTAGYTKGTSSITLSGHTGLVVGSMIHLNQLNDDGYPTSSDVWLCDSGSGTGCNYTGTGDCGSPGGDGIAGSCVTQDALVTACGTSTPGAACTSNTITINPPLTGPTMRSGRTNSVHWADSTLQWAGLEDMSIDFSSAAAQGNVGIEITNCTNCWIRNVRAINTNTLDTGVNYHVYLQRSTHLTVQDSYFFRQTFTEQENYGIWFGGVGSVLIENNIFHGSFPLITDNSFNNSVIGYNFWLGGPSGQGVSYGKHLGGESMILLEGNIGRTFWADNQDGVACCHVFFRNALVGNRYSTGVNIGNIHSAFSINAKNRMFSVIGNVIGHSLYNNTYEGLGATVEYDLGDGVVISNDSLVASTMMRWGNWDAVTSTGDNTDGDQTGTRWNSGEVPSGISFMPNSVPASQTLPYSLYKSSSSYHGMTLPLIGPDVSGGITTSLGGHVKLNPAGNCYINTMGGATDGNGGPYSFTCW